MIGSGAGWVPFSRLSLILVTGAFLLPSLAHADGSSIRWQTGLGEAVGDTASAAPEYAANASLPILWQTGLGLTEAGGLPHFAGQTPPVSAAPPTEAAAPKSAADGSLPILWHTGLDLP